VITLTKDAESRPEETKILLEIEICTISDDSNKGENKGKRSPKSDSLRNLLIVRMQTVMSLYLSYSVATSEMEAALCFPRVRRADRYRQ
jgi:hypothetical protein